MDWKYTVRPIGILLYKYSRAMFLIGCCINPDVEDFSTVRNILAAHSIDSCLGPVESSGTRSESSPVAMSNDCWTNPNGYLWVTRSDMKKKIKKVCCHNTKRKKNRDSQSLEPELQSVVKGSNPTDYLLACHVSC